MAFFLQLNDLQSMKQQMIVKTTEEDISKFHESPVENREKRMAKHLLATKLVWRLKKKTQQNIS